MRSTEYPNSIGTLASTRTASSRGPPSPSVRRCVSSDGSVAKTFSMKFIDSKMLSVESESTPWGCDASIAVRSSREHPTVSRKNVNRARMLSLATVHRFGKQAMTSLAPSSPRPSSCTNRRCFGAMFSSTESPTTCGVAAITRLHSSSVSAHVERKNSKQPAIFSGE